MGNKKKILISITTVILMISIIPQIQAVGPDYAKESTIEDYKNDTYKFNSKNDEIDLETDYPYIDIVKSDIIISFSNTKTQIYIYINELNLGLPLEIYFIPLIALESADFGYYTTEIATRLNEVSLFKFYTTPTGSFVEDHLNNTIDITKTEDIMVNTEQNAVSFPLNHTKEFDDFYDKIGIISYTTDESGTYVLDFVPNSLYETSNETSNETNLVFLLIIFGGITGIVILIVIIIVKMKTRKQYIQQPYY